MRVEPRWEKPRKIVAERSQESIQADLERYRQLALELGASEAVVIPAAEVVIDERVRGKCFFPRCGSLGLSSNCPPYVMPLDEVRQLVSRFQYAILTRFTVPPEGITGKTISPVSQVKNLEMVCKIESEAFYDGYYLATGFAGGSCKRNLCGGQDCEALKGNRCRFANVARPAMEGIGIDAMLMAARQGWDIYPIGGSLTADMVPFVNRLAIIFIC